MVLPKAASAVNHRLQAYAVSLQMATQAKAISDRVPRGYRRLADQLRQAAAPPARRAIGNQAWCPREANLSRSGPIGVVLGTQAMAHHEYTASPPRPRVGQELGRYRLEALLGEGGMASVYLARHRHLDRTVAIKALHPEAACDPDAVARFLREAKAVASLRHRHIVSIADAQAGTAAHPPYLVLEYLPGQLLSRRVTKDLALPIEESLRLTAQMADALAAAHRAGIVHRDMKPENVMLVPDAQGRDQVKLLDFGLAKFLLPVDDLRTAEGLQVGTPEYLAPEQVRGNPVGPFTDIYSLGCLMHALLTGAPPFQSTWLGGLFRRILREEPRPPSQRRPPGFDPVPPALDALVVRCLSKDPRGRFSSMEAISEALVRIAPENSAPLASENREAPHHPRGP